MRIELTKLSDERHVLEIVRDERRERVECETRSYLTHDLLHFALESEARLQFGFWGSLAAGRTLEQMNDRSGRAMADAPLELAEIERVVGALSSAVKGRTAREMMLGFETYATALGIANPSWLDEALIASVQERMRQLLGRWKATPYGGTMTLEWHV